jgi:predicted DNA binding CopG/RHH family protein
MIDTAEPLDLADLGLELPKTPPTQVVSIRLPSSLLNQIKAFASARDVPYQALIKLLLAESLERRRRSAA